MIKVFLKKGKSDALKRFHPWIFSGAVGRAEGTPKDGDLVEVWPDEKRAAAVGYWGEGSIAIRILSFEPTQIDAAFWKEKLARAFQYRKALGLTDGGETNCYRLLFAEGDGVPGLIVDVYGSVAVVQCHSAGIYRQKKGIVDALVENYGERLTAIYDKSYETLPAPFTVSDGVKNGYLIGGSTVPMVVRENKLQFLVDWETGQKTGFFLDQRDNRRQVGRYAPGKTVLNAFCYTGGFSVYALAAGAREVLSVDVSARAMALTDQNIALNGFADRHTSLTADVMDYLKNTEQTFDLIVVDPPAFAKTIAKRHNAVQAYKRLNALAIKRINPGGFLFTFSCSQVVDEELFYNTLVAAALEAGRQIRVMRRLGQPADHPVNIFHPEGSYLKGLALYVE